MLTKVSKLFKWDIAANAYSTGKILEMEKLPEDLKTIPKEGRVRIFTRQNCPFCELAKDYFSEKNVDFEYFYCDLLGITEE